MLTNRSDAEHVARYYAEGASQVLCRSSAQIDHVVAAAHELAAGRRFVPPELLFLGDPRVEDSPLREVTAREREVLVRVAAGEDNLQISTGLAITERTVRAHLHALYRKLQCDGRTQLAILARGLGLPRLS